MSAHNEFDDLARRKLAEQEPAFVEADWMAMEQLLAAQRKRRRGWLFELALGAGLLLIVGGAWWSMQDRPSGSVEKVVGVEQHAIAPKGVAHQREQQAIAPNVPPLSEADIISASPRHSSEEEALRSVSARTPSKQGSISDVPVPVRSVATIAHAVETRIDPSVPTVGPWSDIVDPIALPPQGAEVLADAPRTKADIDPLIVYVEEDRPLGRSAVQDPSPTGTDPTSAPVAPILTGMEMAPSNHHVTDGAPPMIVEKSTTEADPVPESSATDEVAGRMATGDTLDLPTDSNIAGPSTPEGTTLVAPANPWQISLLMGGSYSTSSYTGGHSDTWNSGSRGRWTAAYGAEVMRMGEHFGFGTGVYYSTYEEELVLDERRLNTTELRDSNYFQSFDTTLLYVIGDVIIDGQVWYLTETIDTSITYLVTGTGTFPVSRRLSDALSARNRVSYVEIPLLFDAHLNRGPWWLGMRAGPTIGVVSGRRGTVPNAGYDDYEPYADKAFRSPLLGFTGRAYIRYQFINGWAIGLEPTYRRHFGNAFGAGDLVRTNSAVGGQLSVTYRLQ